MHRKIGFTALLLLLAIGCKMDERPNMEMVPNLVAELQGAESAHAVLRIGAGDMNIDDQALALMVAEFHYNTPIRVPKMIYNVVDGKGELSLAQEVVPSIGGFARKDRLNKWNVHFEKSVPLELEIEFGKGSGEWNLGGLNLKRLNVLNHQGRVNIDLSALRLKHDVALWIDNEEGELNITFPKGFPVYITTIRGGTVSAPDFKKDKGVYTNGVPETNTSIFVDIKTGTGQVNVR